MAAATVCIISQIRLDTLALERMPDVTGLLSRLDERCRAQNASEAVPVAAPWFWLAAQPGPVQPAATAESAELSHHSAHHLALLAFAAVTVPDADLAAADELFSDLEAPTVGSQTYCLLTCGLQEL